MFYRSAFLSVMPPLPFPPFKVDYFSTSQWLLVSVWDWHLLHTCLPYPDVWMLCMWTPVKQGVGRTPQWPVSSVQVLCRSEIFWPSTWNLELGTVELTGTHQGYSDCSLLPRASASLLPMAVCSQHSISICLMPGLLRETWGFCAGL